MCKFFNIEGSIVMFELYNIEYDKLTHHELHGLYSLRCGVFKERLNWNVPTRKGLEYDEYDNQSANYIFGKVGGILVCSVRLIESKRKTMISGVFKRNFEELDLPSEKYLEASRLFVDKKSSRKLKIHNQPLSTLLFLSMINYSKLMGYSNVYAVVSFEMFLIFRRTGWMIKVLSEGVSEYSERILFISMPTDDENQHIMIEKIKSYPASKLMSLDSWPLLLKL